jgi:hypothetical protein
MSVSVLPQAVQKGTKILAVIVAAGHLFDLQEPVCRRFSAWAAIHSADRL